MLVVCACYAAIIYLGGNLLASLDRLYPIFLVINLINYTVLPTFLLKSCTISSFSPFTQKLFKTNLMKASLFLGFVLVEVIILKSSMPCFTSLLQLFSGFLNLYDE